MPLLWKNVYSNWSHHTVPLLVTSFFYMLIRKSLSHPHLTSCSDLIGARYLLLIDQRVGCRVSSKTSFVSKQPNLEPKLVSALSETRHLFQLFRFNIKTGGFGVSKQPKQTKDQSKQQQIFFNINLFNFSYHKFFCFSCFDTAPKHQNKPKKKKNFGGSVKKNYRKTTETD
jgi:hypothetical protein